MDIDHVSLYLTELIYLRNGRPVWEPNPDTLYDCVRIGDVGYFQKREFRANLRPQTMLLHHGH